MRHWLVGLTFVFGVTLGIPAADAAPRVSVTFSPAMSQEPLTGRLLLIFSPGGEGEPRSHVIWDDDAIPFFGLDVEGWKPGQRKHFDARVNGFPLRSIADLPDGEYSVQAVLNRYEKFTRSDGHTLWLPPDQGEGQVWHRKPGNLYSQPLKVRIDGKRRGRIELVLDQKIPPVAAFEDQQTDYVRYLRIRSERLSAFWGRDTYLAAWVRLPWGYREHPEARYPLVIAHGHFPAGPGGFRELPPDPGLAPEYSKRFSLEGYNRIQQEYEWQAHKDWITPGFPRVLLVEIQHPTPFYDDSYAVNSANNGPYGDAIQYELIPESRRSSAPSAPAGRVSFTAVRPADGKRWRFRCSTRTTTTARGSPARTPSISGTTKRSTSTRTGTRTTPPMRTSARRALRTATGSAMSTRRSRK